MIPPFIFIDHGHFQPNSVMHGLVLWGVYHLIRGRIELSVIVMVLAVNFKQMALYFALPFAIYAFSQLLQRASSKYKGQKLKQLLYFIFRILILIAIFILATALIWYPWLSQEGA